MKPFQVDERVKVYGHLGPWTGTITKVNEIVSSRYQDAKGMLYVKSDADKCQWPAHPRQCVRLKPKKAEERVERWYYPACEKYSEVYTAHPQSKGQRCHHLVELKDGEVIVDREKLAQAWDKNQGTLLQVNTHEPNYFREFCDDLGIPKEKA